MALSKPSIPVGTLGFLPVEELRAQIWASKKARRARVASLPILEKFRIMDQMKQAADPIRAYRRRVRAYDQR
jgi:hypothetical protein